MLPDRAPRPASALPPELIGRWQQVLPNGSIALIAFRDDGFTYAIDPFTPVVFGPGETTMTVGPATYTRIFGTGPTVQGVWREDSTGAEYFYRTNGTFNIGEAGEIDLFGTYEERAGALETAEARALVSVDGGDLIYDIVFGGQFRQSFAVQGDTLTLGGSATLTRVPEMIYKIFRAEEWQLLRKTGQTTGAPIDVQDGYIHFSTAPQAAETAARHFSGQADLFLIAVETAPLGAALVWEVSRGGAQFPHLYREMTLEDVHWALPLPLEQGCHVFPPGAGFA